MGRKCAVPHCYTGYRKCKEKASLYRVPDDDFFLSKWQEAIARDDRPITPKDYVCEKHFKDDDILRKRIIKDVVEEYQRPRLKPDAIPSVFPDLPEFILKMVKKRRKMPTEDAKNTETTSPLKHNENEEVKVEIPEANENVASTVCETILNNEVDIKSEPEEHTDRSIESDEDSDKDDVDYGPKMHQCDQCEYQTKYPHNLRTHKTKHLTGEEAYIRCEHCPSYKTKWELTYRNHLKIKHGIGKQEIFKCDQCNFETKVKLCLKRHSERHQKGLTIILCDFPGCNFRNEDKSVVAVHKLSHSLETNAEKSKNFKCTECFYETNSKTHIIRHIKSTHNTGDDTIVSVNVHKKSRHDMSERESNANHKTNYKPLYKCLKCPYRSKSQTNLLRHVFNHKDVKLTNDERRCNVWKCPKCPFATFFQHALQKHQETQCRNLFLCNECDFKSNHKPDYIKHLLTHRNISVESVNQDEFVRKRTESNIPQRIDNSEIFRGDKIDNSKLPVDERVKNKIPELVIIKNEITDNVE